MVWVLNHAHEGEAKLQGDESDGTKSLTSRMGN
jgi:hypothetical protein